MHHTFEGDKHRFFRSKAYGFVEQGPGLIPFAGHDCQLKGEMEGVLVGGIVDAPTSHLFPRPVVFSAPHIDLANAVACCFSGIEWTTPLKHVAGVIEEA